MADKKQPYIHITKEGINYSFNAFNVKDEEGYTWYIPTFDMYFSSETEDEGIVTAVAMTKAFFRYWIEKESFRNFILEINRLGFKANENHNSTIKRLIDRKERFAKFKSTIANVPTEFREAKIVEMDSHFAMAV